MIAAQFLLEIASLFFSAFLHLILLPLYPIFFLVERLRQNTNKTFWTVLITGASSGIGESLAKQLSRPGCKLVLTGQNKQRLEAVAEHCRQKGAEVNTYAISVCDAAAMDRMIEDEDRQRAFDLVIANAAATHATLSLMTIEESLNPITQVNVSGLVNTILPAIKRMRLHQRGHIALVSSLASYFPSPIFPEYAATKAYVRILGEGLRPMLSSENIHVSVVCPGYVDTRMIAPLKGLFRFFGLLSADEASAIILKGLQSNYGVICFPFWTSLIASIVGGLPSIVKSSILEVSAMSKWKVWRKIRVKKASLSDRLARFF